MDIRAIGLGLAFAFMWSSAFTSARIIVMDAPPLTALALRFLISGLIAVTIAKMLGQTWRLTPIQWRATLVFGICQNSLYLGLNFVAMQTIEASIAAIIASTMPLLVAFVGWLVFKERIKPVGILGLIGGFAGVSLIMGSRLLSAEISLYGLGLCALGVLALTFATLSVRSASSGGNILMIVGLQMLIGCGALSVAAFLFEEWVINWNSRLIAAFAYTTIVPGLLATWVWFTLVNKIGAVKAATFHFLNPFLGVATAAILLGEPLGLADVIGVAIIAISILAVQRARRPVS